MSPQGGHIPNPNTHPSSQGAAEPAIGANHALPAPDRGEQRLALALEAAGMVMWEWDIVHDRIAVGPPDWLGYPPEEQPGSADALRALMHPDDRLHAIACMDEHLRGRTGTYQCQYRLRARNGEYIWIASQGCITERDADGRPLRVMGVRRNIEAEKRTEADRLEHARLVEHAFDAMFVWSTRRGIERWNRGAERLYGYSASEALGAVSHELLKTQFSVPLTSIEQALDVHGVWRGELSHQRKDGCRILVQTVIQRVAGERHRVLEIARDVTRERATRDRLELSETRLRQSQERLAIALEAGRMGVWEWAIGSDEAFWSPQVFELVGLPPVADGRAHSSDFLDLIHPDDRTRIDALVARLLTHGGHYEIEFRIRKAMQGEERWILSRGTMLPRDGDSMPRIVGINMDISARKALEGALKLDDERRNEFLATLGHELRNPLAPISNAVRLLERVGDQPERRAAALAILSRQTQHMARLVDDLLEISRITQGRIELRIENMLVATPIFAAVETARPMARERGQHIDVDVSHSLDLVADPARVTQIISNLVVNAVKYTPNGGHIWVSARERDGWIEIAVRDTGFGIPKEHQQRIFDLFTQDGRTIDKARGGLGIGLALVRRLAQLHGGSVQCDSAGDGHGSTFTVLLPKHGRRQDIRSSPIAHAAAGIAPLSVLVVDEDRDSAESIATLLRLDGHRVEVAVDGDDAVELASQHRPKLVLLDLDLPGIDDHELVRRLRSAPPAHDMLIVAMSPPHHAHTHTHTPEASAAAGYDVQLAKPVNMDQLYRLIREKLGH